MKLYINSTVRQLALVSNDYVLVFKTTTNEAAYNDRANGQNNFKSGNGVRDNGTSHSIYNFGATNGKTDRDENINTDNSQSSQLPKRSVVVESFHVAELESRGFKLVESLLIEGFLGLVNVGDEIFLGLINTSQQVAHPRWKWNNEINGIQPIEAVNKILNASFVSLTNNTYDNFFLNASGVVESRFFGSTDKNYLNKIGSTSRNNSSLIDENIGGYYHTITDEDINHPCYELKKLFCDGTFYFSREFDLTNNLQERGMFSSMDYIIEKFDEKYVWNINMIYEMIQFRSRISVNEKAYLDKGKFITFVIRGFCRSKLSALELANPTCVTIITKISTENKRSLLGVGGIDNEGNVSNFCESEVILSTNTHIFSYIICYGNMPLSWEIQESQILHSKKIKLNKSPENTQAVFDKHFDSLSSKYGVVSVVNLVKPKSHSQNSLNDAYHSCAKLKGMRYTSLEYSSDILTKFTHKLLYHMKEDILDFGALVYDIKRGIYCGKQTGVIRISAFNSLKKPFLVEKSVSQEVIELAVQELGELQLPPDFDHIYEKVWKEHNFFMTRLYDKNLKHKESFQKLYRALFSLKVTLYDPLHSYIVNYLKKRRKEFLYDETIKIFSGTFNVGGTLYKGDISRWLFPSETTKLNTPNIYVIGLEEVVELTPGQMLSTDTFVKPFWENTILKTLNENSKDKHYVYLWGGQLGGILMLIFISEPEYSNVKKLEGDVRKLGFGGISANKGTVAVRFVYSTTKFCFIVSHLAAGLQNVEQRHNDYKTVNKNIRFARGITIKDHDAVIWMGDFNYRLLLSNEETRALIKGGNYQKLFEKDQLNQQMISGESFPYYNEMDIKFPPTYKFDPGTKNYDTSEKNRIPAWTDRVLSRGDILTQLEYGCCEDIIFSDHRPVYSIFDANVTLVNEPLKMKLANEIYETLQKELLDLDIQEKFDLLQIAENSVHIPTNVRQSLDEKEPSFGFNSNYAGIEMSDGYNSRSNSNTNGISGHPVRASGPGIEESFVINPNGIDLKVYSTSSHMKLAPPSTDKKKWWIGDGKQATITVDIDPLEYMINPKKSKNPFDADNSEPFFVPRTETEDDLQETPLEPIEEIKSEDTQGNFATATSKSLEHLYNDIDQKGTDINQGVQPSAGIDKDNMRFADVKSR